jgi:hypothetical protein
LLVRLGDPAASLTKSLEDKGVPAYTEQVGGTAIQWEYCFGGIRTSVAAGKAFDTAHVFSTNHGFLQSA